MPGVLYRGQTAHSHGQGGEGGARANIRAGPATKANRTERISAATVLSSDIGGCFVGSENELVSVNVNWSGLASVASFYRLLLHEAAF